MHDEIFQESLNAFAYSDAKTKVWLRLIKENDGDALESIVNENMPLVRSIVKRYINRGCEYDDLLQLGTIGLIKAAKNYDFTFDVRFSTYAVPMIMGEIKRFLRDDGIIKISRSIKENARAVARARDELSDKLGREPSIGEIAQLSRLSEEDIVEALDASRPVSSIYEVVSEDGDSQLLLMDRLEDNDTSINTDVEKRIMLEELLKSLSEDERKLIVLRYYRDMTQTDVAGVMNISQVQVSRLEKKILMKLREKAV